MPRKPFPTRRGEVAPAAKQEVALLITAMLASVAVCCGVLNLFLRADRTWSLYVIGASAMLWLWLVPPLLARGMHLLLRLLLDIAAVALYVYLIAFQWGLVPGSAAPIILWGGAIVWPGLVLRVYRRSATTLTILIGSIGVFVFGMEVLCGPLAAPTVEPVLVPGGAHHLHRNGDSAHHYSLVSPPSGRRRAEGSISERCA